MTLKQLDGLLSSNDINKVKEVLQITYDMDVIKTALKQYHPHTHDVFDTTLRENRPIYAESNILDDDGNKKLTLTGYKKVNRIAVPLQKQIVLLRSAFIGSPSMQANADSQEEIDCLQVLGKIWDDNKMSFRFSDTKKRTMSELRCAWLWYNIEDKDYWEGQPIKSSLRPRVKLLSHELGDALYPVFDINDDLIAFGRGYTSIQFDENNVKTEVEHLDIFTAEKFYFKKRLKGEWIDNYTEDDILVAKEEGGAITNYKPNLVGKIPITYFYQPAPEWSDVQTACDRIETLVSNHGEANDYNAWPILFGKGTTISMPDKEAMGKYVEGTGDSDLKFVTWNNAPESIKLELENLFEFVYNLTNTVRYKDFETLGQMSGFAIQLRFLLPTLRAKDSEMSIFGEGVQRAYNYLKKLVSVLDKKYLKTLSLQITPVFNSALPTDEMEIITKINSAVGGGIMSKESGMEQNPLVEDAEDEKDRIDKEKEEAQANAMATAKATSSFPVKN